MTEEEKWKERFNKERLIRKESERILEEKSLELYDVNQVLENQKNELETIFETSIDGIAIVDLQTSFIYFNQAYQIMSGYTKEALLTKSCIEISAPEDREKTRQAMEFVLKEGHLHNFEQSCLREDGEKLIINMSIALMPNKQELLISAKDITEPKRKEKQIQAYMKLIDNNIITSSTDLDGIITYASNAFCEISGFTLDELIHKNHSVIRHPDMPKSLFKEMWDTVTNDKTWEGEIKNLKKYGGYYWVKASISPIFNEENIKVGYSAIRQDITDKKTIEILSITDGLTNIYNRRHFNDTFPKEIEKLKRSDDLFCFLIMDIDHFKQYNDIYGHQIGDDALVNVANTIKNSLKRDDDYCFRLGGEEFGVIFKTSNKEDGLYFANKIKQNIEDLQIKHIGSTTSSYLTVSIGLICQSADEIKNADEVYKNADDLLYEVKKSGRNKVAMN